MTEVSSDNQQQKGRRGCRGCLGCLAAVAGLAVLVVALVWFAPSIVRWTGLSGPSAEELYAGAPDRIASEALNESLNSAGIEGVDALVIPISGSEGQIAVFTVRSDLAAPGAATEEEANAAFMEALRGLTEANRSGDLGIEQVAVDLPNESGGSLVTLTAPQAAVEAYADGSITRREFLAQVDVDLSNLISAAELRELVTEVQ
jgi:hypothetical protein